jgi:hypothetical protein
MRIAKYHHLSFGAYMISSYLLHEFDSLVGGEAYITSLQTKVLITLSKSTLLNLKTHLTYHQNAIIADGDC